MKAAAVMYTHEEYILGRKEFGSDNDKVEVELEDYEPEPEQKDTNPVRRVLHVRLVQVMISRKEDNKPVTEPVTHAMPLRHQLSYSQF